MRLLIVDDDQVFREELAELLKEEGHTAETASSVPKAIERLEQTDFDVVLTDLKMPRHGGMELLEQVRDRWPRTLSIMITGFATIESAVDAMKLGAFDYVRKPFQIGQVQQVLKMAEQELKFRGVNASETDPESLVRGWVRKDGLDVLLVMTAPEKPREHVTVVPLNPEEPFRIRSEVEGFLSSRARGAVLIEGAELLLKGRRRSDILTLLRSLRELVEPKGPFVVTFDPEKTSQDEVTELRAVLAAPASHGTLESISNPIRRAVLRRAAQGACTFNQAMQAAGLDDSPKLSFHMRKLVEDGLLLHQEDKYRVTPRGEEAVRLLGEVDALPLAGAQGSAVLPTARRG